MKASEARKLADQSQDLYYKTLSKIKQAAESGDYFLTIHVYNCPNVDDLKALGYTIERHDNFITIGW